MRTRKFLLLLLLLFPSSAFASADYSYEHAVDAVKFLQQFFDAPPKTAIVLGSGLGAVADIIDVKAVIDVRDVPNWPSPTAPGHAGKILAGTIEGRPCVILQGRVHYYEGYSMKAVTFPVRVPGMLGVKEYIATNASGAINTSYSPGDIIAVKDHINLMGTNPLSGPNEPRWNTRFPDMATAYDRKILAYLAELGLKQGVYAAFMGPSYETPAEARMAGIFGADLAGMSTVPEIITANAMGMRCACLSCVASMSLGVEPDEAPSEQEVLDKMKETSGELAGLLVKLIHKLNQE